MKPIILKHEKSWLRAQHAWPKTPINDDRIKEIVEAQLASSGRRIATKERPPASEKSS